MIFMAVNTPTKTVGEGAGMALDLRFIEACAHDIAKYSNLIKLLLKSQHFLLEQLKKLKKF